MSPTPPDELAAGVVLGKRYRLEEPLKSGGMGDVWSASHLVTKRRVAVKVLRTTGRDDKATRARLLREARASCAIDHPAVLPVLDVVEARGAPALVMDLLSGESLRERLDRSGALSPSETCRILADVASALAAAHAARVVHRDVKPENIFLLDPPRDGARVKVLDFGVAKILAPEATAGATGALTETGAMLGTPYYMSPEQAFGERDVGPAADAWAFGIVVHECLAGVRPTAGENLGQVIKRITQEPIPRVEEIVPGVPPALAAVVRRLLERDPAVRETDLAAVARTLAALGDEEVPATPVEAPVVVASGASTRRGARIAVAVACAVVAVGLATTRLLHEPTREAETAPGGRIDVAVASPPTSGVLPGTSVDASVDLVGAVPTGAAPTSGASPSPPRAKSTIAPPAATTTAAATLAPARATARTASAPATPSPSAAPGPGRVIIEAPF